MKNRFKEHHILEELDNIYANAIIVLDTNAVLNLYRYNIKNRTKYSEILHKVSDRIYLTHQIGLEFYKNRLRIIEDRIKFKTNIFEMISENQKKLMNILENCSGGDTKYSSSLSILIHEYDLKAQIYTHLKESLDSIKLSIDNFKQDLNISYIQQNDPILNDVVSIIGDKVHIEFSKEDLEEIYKEGESRYEKEIPPGYKDKDKKGNDKYNDLVIWKEIIELSKLEKRDILFISDDRKEDWAIKPNGKDFGTRKELIKEFIDSTNQFFYSITTTGFIEKISSIYNIEDTELLIEETESIIKNTEGKEMLDIHNNNQLGFNAHLYDGLILSYKNDDKLKQYYKAIKTIENLNKSEIKFDASGESIYDTSKLYEMYLYEQFLKNKYKKPKKDEDEDEDENNYALSE